MTITFIGHGYVGLVTATVFANLGNTVWVIGHTPEKIENLKKGVLPIYEPGLEEMVKRNVLAKRLLFTLAYDTAMAASDVVFIAVGTPPKQTGEADLSVVFDVAKKIATHLTHHTIVVTKSTVPVGTNREIKKIIDGVKPSEISYDIASCPEFLREGQAISDTEHPDRIVIGTKNKATEAVLVRLHEPITGERVLTKIETAEMIKYAANAFLATKISFANAIAQLSEKTGADAVAVLEAIGKDKRIGSYFLNAGAGYGGSCFPKDVKALIAISDTHGYDFKLLKEVEQINADAMALINAKIMQQLGGSVSGKRIGVLGLSFKPDTDDMRDAPAIVIINALQKEGAMVTAYDPIAMKNAKTIFGKNKIMYASTAYATATDAELLLVVTEWDEFKQLDMAKIKSLMKSPRLVDARNMYDPERMKALGFKYSGVGR